ncbi:MULTISPECIES: PspA/IM30 family protein [unclassified Brevundimonas]|uniref:PspA/IM30 family protein n=1 Tax=unclassified Brevundimonas TaxID=2622653 RepID=UPI0006F32B72|nr:MULTISPECIES: PspA/IM30 family protein [unclassified Brevundimonas]KQY91081.1 phage shock protein A [Brevundimonas sp. Root1423]KRA22062.1 phage shock protein A [Brevundimonas sp. Root608]
MSMLAKLSALFRGTAHDTAQSVVDANALKILDQEIRDADNNQGKARDDLAGLVARRRMAETELKSFQDQISKYENSARTALDRGQNDLALEVAGRIAELETEIGNRGPLIENMKAAEVRLRTAIATTDQKIETLRREIDIVKVNDSVQKAQTSVALQSAGAQSRIGSAADSLQRIKQRQAVNEEKLIAGQELEDRRTGADLDAKLKAAGILPGQSSANDVLARLTAREIKVVTPLIEQGAPVHKDPA